jgi:hypothetical protein
MGAPGPRFPANFSGFLVLYAPFRVDKVLTRSCPALRTGNSGGLVFETGFLHANAGLKAVVLLP